MNEIKLAMLESASEFFEGLGAPMSAKIPRPKLMLWLESLGYPFPLVERNLDEIIWGAVSECRGKSPSLGEWLLVAETHAEKIIREGVARGY